MMARKPLITVSLKPGTKVQPKWPFAEFSSDAAGSLAEDPKDTRDKLAAFITAYAQLTSPAFRADPVRQVG